MQSTDEKWTEGHWALEACDVTGAIYVVTGAWPLGKTICENVERADGNLICAAQDMDKALGEAERFMAYFAGETDNSFVGPGTPKTCLEQIRAVRRKARGEA